MTQAEIDDLMASLPEEERLRIKAQSEVGITFAQQMTIHVTTSAAAAGIDQGLALSALASYIGRVMIDNGMADTAKIVGQSMMSAADRKLEEPVS